MRSEPGAVATGSRDFTGPWIENAARSLPLPVLTSLTEH